MILSKKQINTKLKNKKIFSILMGITLSMSLLYIFLIGNIVFNIVERKDIEANVREISSNISSLEVEYLSLQNSIDIEYASSLGFNEGQSIAFVKEGNEANAITLR